MVAEYHGALDRIAKALWTIARVLDGRCTLCDARVNEGVPHATNCSRRCPRCDDIHSIFKCPEKKGDSL